MSQHKVGMIGCGWFSHFYAKVLPWLAERMELVWVADPDQEKARALAAKTGARPLEDYRDGLDEVDAVFVLVPHHLHHPMRIAHGGPASSCSARRKKSFSRAMRGSTSDPRSSISWTA